MEIPKGENISTVIIEAVEANMKKPEPQGSIVFTLGERKLDRKEVESLRMNIRKKKARKLVIHGACVTVICI